MSMDTSSQTMNLQADFKAAEVEEIIYKVFFAPTRSGVVHQVLTARPPLVRDFFKLFTNVNRCMSQDVLVNMHFRYFTVVNKTLLQKMAKMILQIKIFLTSSIYIFLCLSGFVKSWWMMMVLCSVIASSFRGVAMPVNILLVWWVLFVHQTFTGFTHRDDATRYRSD